eukprot:1000752-Prymnesium_polylepis.2
MPTHLADMPYRRAVSRSQESGERGLAPDTTAATFPDATAGPLALAKMLHVRRAAHARNTTWARGALAGALAWC